MRFAYIRVSTAHQDLDRQRTITEGADEVVEEYASASSRERPKLSNMLLRLRSGDEIVVHSVDRLARNLRDLLTIVKEVGDKGATIHFVKEDITTGPEEEMTAMNKMQLYILGVAADLERTTMLERQAEAREARRRAGKNVGRKSKLSDAQKLAIHRSHAHGVTMTRLAKDYNVSRTLIHNVLRNG